MTLSLRPEYTNLPNNVHAYFVSHGRKEYQCEECFNYIPKGTSLIRVGEEVPQTYGRSFDNHIYCSRTCLEKRYHLQVRQ